MFAATIYYCNFFSRLNITYIMTIIGLCNRLHIFRDDEQMLRLKDGAFKMKVSRQPCILTNLKTISLPFPDIISVSQS